MKKKTTREKPTTKKERILFVDGETGGPVDIKTRGAWNYAKEAHIILMAYRFSDWKAGVVKFVLNFERDVLTADDIPDEIKNHTGPVVVHNWSFEHAIFTHCLPFLPHYSNPDSYFCTAATARRMGLPGSLYDACKALNLDHKKDKKLGDMLIRRYSIPDKNGLFRKVTDDDKKAWVEYNKGDVLAMENLFAVLPRLDADPFEAPVFRLDQKMNLRGLRVDVKAVGQIKEAYENLVADAEKEAKDLCGVEASEVLTVSSTQGFGRWLKSENVTVDDVQAATLKDVAAKTNNAKVKRAIELRTILAAAGPKKLDAFLTFADDAGDVRHAFFYGGAHTLRWAGRGIQPQNFVRAAAQDWGQTFEKVCAGGGTVKDINSLLRGCIIPRKGHSFAVGDFAAIETRGLFYLARCESGLRAFRTGADIYKEFAAKLYRKGVKDVTKEERQVGKAAVLGLGYGMGKDRFFDYCEMQGLAVSRELAEQTVNLYRNTFPEVPRFWRESEEALKTAFRDGAAVMACGVRFHRSADKKFIRVSFPGGAAMYYFRPKLLDGVLHVTLARGGLQKLWGGVIVENLVQSFSRHLLAFSMLKAEGDGLQIVGTVHDEIIAEVKTKDKMKGLKVLQAAMSTAPEWAADFPLASECNVIERYGK